MHAIFRRYEGIDSSRIDELTRKVNESLVPRLSKLPGFKGYFVTEAGNGVIKSTGLFDTQAQADDSSRVAAEWVQEENLAALIPNAPNVSVRKVIAFAAPQTAHETKVPALV